MQCYVRRQWKSCGRQMRTTIHLCSSLVTMGTIWDSSDCQRVRPCRLSLTSKYHSWSKVLMSGRASGEFQSITMRSFAEILVNFKMQDQIGGVLRLCYVFGLWFKFKVCNICYFLYLLGEIFFPEVLNLIKLFFIGHRVNIFHTCYSHQ